MTEPEDPDSDPYSLLADEAEFRLVNIGARQGGGFLVDLRHDDNVFAIQECVTWQEVVALLGAYGSEVENAVTRARAHADQLHAGLRDRDDS